MFFRVANNNKVDDNNDYDAGRAALLAACSIKEKELQLLINDLSSKPANQANFLLIRDALLGKFSDFDSRLDCPMLTLIGQLNITGYEDLAKKAYLGEYDHMKGASIIKENATRPTNTEEETPRCGSPGLGN